MRHRFLPSALLLSLFFALSSQVLAQNPEEAGACAIVAAATEEEAPAEGFEAARQAFDKGFGEYVVGPFASLLFFDVVFWDDPPSAEDPVSSFDTGESADNPAVQAVMLNWINGDPAALEGMVGAEDAATIIAARPDACFESLSAVPLSDHAGYLLWRHATAKNVPFVVLWLVFGAIFFTFRYRFPNLRAFGHAIAVTMGKYDEEGSTGEVSHFQALSSALSATVGLGNIAGVAVAVGVGGPGAVFWMVVAAFFGMVSKFSECTLGQMYREVDANGNVSGGPMRYLDKGLDELGFPKLGKVLAVAFAIMCVFGSFGGGNMFQANQSYAQVSAVLPIFQSDGGSLIYGLILAAMVGVVIIGGIKRIGLIAGYIVPVMVGIYFLAGIFVLVVNAGAIPEAFGKIIGEAFAPEAVGGGAIGVLIQGFRRAAFSNEAGVGSASIAHSAASTEEPVREGIVALLEPFIDTIIVCTMTGLVVVITGAYQGGATGVEMTSQAFDTVIPNFSYVLSFAVFMFAFSTLISWSYYGERCWTYLFGTGSSLAYKVIFLCFVVIGSVLNLGSVLDFSDLMILGMAFPNVLGMYFLSGKVRAAFDDYWKRLQNGEMKTSGAKNQ